MFTMRLQVELYLQGEMHFLLSTALLHKLMILQVKTVLKIQQIVDPMKTID